MRHLWLKARIRRNCRQFAEVRIHKGELVELKKDASEEIDRLAARNMFEPVVGNVLCLFTRRYATDEYVLPVLACILCIDLSAR